MLIIIHRVNTIKSLLTVPHEFGVEIDVRAYKGDLVLTHDPYKSGDKLEDYLKKYNHSFIIFNIKEAGIEKKVIELADKYKIKDYFLLDVEPYWIHHATEGGFKNIAIRYSENEPIEMALKYKHKANWLWIDIPTKLPISEGIVKKMKGYKTCLVCPERWGRPFDIPKYISKIKKLNFKLDAIMTSEKHVEAWKNLDKYYNR